MFQIESEMNKLIKSAFGLCNRFKLLLLLLLLLDISTTSIKTVVLTKLINFIILIFKLICLSVGE